MKLKSFTEFLHLMATNPKLFLSCKYDTPLQNFRYKRAAKLYEEGEDILVRLLLEELLEKLKLEMPKKVDVEALHEGKRGSLFPYEIKAIATITKALNPKNVLEIGTYEGRASLNIALNLNKNSKLYTMDLPQGKDSSFKVGKFFHNSKVSNKIQQIEADSMKFDFSKLPKMDMIFIDGAHGYYPVFSDTQNAMKILNKNGIILWDDVDNCHLGSTEAVYSQCQKKGFYFYLLSGTKMAVAWKKDKS